MQVKTNRGKPSLSMYSSDAKTLMYAKYLLDFVGKNEPDATLAKKVTDAADTVLLLVKMYGAKFLDQDDRFIEPPSSSAARSENAEAIAKAAHGEDAEGT